jgi:hypothetical protein
MERCAQLRHLAKPSTPRLGIAGYILEDSEQAGDAGSILNTARPGPGYHCHIANIIIDGSAISSDWLGKRCEDRAEILLRAQITTPFGVSGRADDINQQKYSFLCYGAMIATEEKIAKDLGAKQAAQAHDEDESRRLISE